jgi:hypothetical protein
MSHTPLDGSNGRTPDRESEPSDAADSSGFGGVVERVRSACGRLGRTLRSWLAPTDGTDPVDADEYADTLTATASRGTDVTTRVGEDRVVHPVVSDATGPERVPVPDDDRPRERPELEAQWGEDRLTLAEPDEPGARITSDTWSDVDP